MIHRNHKPNPTWSSTQTHRLGLGVAKLHNLPGHLELFKFGEVRDLQKKDPKFQVGNRSTNCDKKSTILTLPQKMSNVHIWLPSDVKQRLGGKPFQEKNI